MDLVLVAGKNPEAESSQEREEAGVQASELVIRPYQAC